VRLFLVAHPPFGSQLHLNTDLKARRNNLCSKHKSAFLSCKRGDIFKNQGSNSLNFRTSPSHSPLPQTHTTQALTQIRHRPNVFFEHRQRRRYQRSGGRSQLSDLSSTLRHEESRRNHRAGVHALLWACIRQRLHQNVDQGGHQA